MSDHPTHLQFEGMAGVVDCAVDWPTDTPRGWALVLHPHPLHGGARGNKVVTTIARACVAHGLVAIRPDFRGVGASAGEFDKAHGETLDMLKLVQQWLARFPAFAQTPWVLAGFSFGTAVAAQLHAELAEVEGVVAPSAIILAGTAVKRFLYRSVALPTDTLLVHGVEDEVVPYSEVEAWAATQGLRVNGLPDATHFFHGKLIDLKEIVANTLDQRLPRVQ